MFASIFLAVYIIAKLVYEYRNNRHDSYWATKYELDYERADARLRALGIEY